MGCGPGPLDDDHEEALRAIQRVTGHRFKTCPLAGAWEAWVHRAVAAEEHGLSEDSVAHGPPPRALVEAVSVLRRARARRDAEEARAAREKAKK